MSKSDYEQGVRDVADLVLACWQAMRAGAAEAASLAALRAGEETRLAVRSGKPVSVVRVDAARAAWACCMAS